MRKKGVVMLLRSSCLVVMLMTTLLPVAYGQKVPEPKKLTMVSAYPLANITINYAPSLFKKYVEAWSAGRIRIDFKGGTEVIAFSEIPRVTERGVFDISYTCPPYVGSQYPAFQLFNFMTPANERIAHRDNELWIVMDKITRNHGMIFLGSVNGDCPNFIVFSKPPSLDKDGKIATLKGLKIRTAGPFDADLISNLGGTPVSMHPGEIYEGLRTKLIDGAVTPMNNAILSQYWGVISSISTEAIYTFNAMLFMNAKRFDKLPQADRELIMVVANEVQAASYNYTGALTSDGLSSDACFAKIPKLSFSREALKNLAETRLKKLSQFAAAEPKHSKEIIKAFTKYYSAQHLPLSTEQSLSR